MTTPSSTSGPYHFRHKHGAPLHAIRGPWIVEGPGFRMEVEDRTKAAILARKLNEKHHAGKSSGSSRDAATLRWKRPAPEVWVSEPAPITFRDAYGSTRTTSERFRVDGRNKAREGYRVDRSSLMGWEAIDRMEGAKTATEGKKLAAAFLKAANEHHTLSPKSSTYGRDVRRNRHARRSRTGRDPRTGTHRGNADLIRWYLRHAREADRQLFSGKGADAAERRRKARATTARNVQVLRRVDRAKALGFVRSLGYRG